MIMKRNSTLAILCRCSSSGVNFTMLPLYGCRKASLGYLSFNDSQLYQNMHLFARNLVSHALQVMRVAILVAVIVKNLFLMLRKTN